MDENKFTPTAEEALQLAQEAAGELGHGYMGTEHLLLGLMREDEGLAHTVLTEAGLTDDLLTEMIRKSVGTGLSGSNSAQSLSPRAKHVLEIAMEDAARGGRWTGDVNMCVAENEFKITGVEDCFARGFQRMGFKEYDTGRQGSWMVQLSDTPGTQESQN